MTAETTGVARARAERIAALGFDYGARPTRRVERCNLCASDRLVGLTHRDRYGYPAAAHACASCGLVFLNPVMTAAAYGEFYQHTYRPLVSAYHGRLIDARTIQDEQRVYAEARAALLRPYLAGAGARTLLDIGGSTGVVAHALTTELGLHGTLIDPSPLEIEEARRLGLETVTGLVEEHDFGAVTFDVIIMCQTIDHLLDVTGTLARVRALLAPGGLFFVDIVDFRAAYLRNWSVSEAVKIDHPYYLTEPVTGAFLARAGFDVLRTDYADDRLHVSYICRGGTPDPGARPSPHSVDALLREIRYVQNTKGGSWSCG